jgi:hypothetical protein
MCEELPSASAVSALSVVNIRIRTYRRSIRLFTSAVAALTIDSPARMPVGTGSPPRAGLAPIAHPSPPAASSPTAQS